MSGSISNAMGSPLSQNIPPSINIAPPIEKSTNEPLKLFSEKQGNCIVAMLYPMLTVSEANGGQKTSVKRGNKTIFKSEHWSEKNHRHKKQKAMVALMLRKFRSDFKIPCLITLTRYAPNKLDRHDNLPMSMKWILDAVCEIITGDYRPGRADDNEEIDVKYRQIISKEYAVKIEVT